ncbi:response regulator transcription factor [Undibacterium sp. CY18W]|uniref:Response regulator transcription factor n=1 Tax=Undibacterium hunanense TaxID=2762292 RepID=A0ABR6ZSJ6_9BURK|nr:response regulator transcription factor [Undibacterium hunanense]MBC3918829.1 response regulator transcription factor [Undibacterium hunanense]
MPYKILIIDDHALVREGLAMLVSALPGGASIYMAGTATEALEQAEYHTPLDAVLLDCGLPDADGGSLIHALSQRAGRAPVVLVSADESDATIQRMMKLGAAAFVPKSKTSSDVINAIKLALTGGAPASARQVGADILAALNPLTARQLDVLLMLEKGMTNRDIALQLGLAEKTVKNHVTALLNGLGVINRLQAIRRARDLGLLK